MANVKMTFRGTKSCDWETVDEMIDLYLSLSVTYTLERVDFSLDKVRDGNDIVVTGANFQWGKTINDQDLLTVHEIWKTICSGNGITKQSVELAY